MSPPTLDERIEALRVAARLLEPFTSAQLQGAVSEVEQRAQVRAGVGLEKTVVALAGSTGSGKSSLFNATTGFALAEVGVRRPTTADPLVCWWGGRAPDGLLDWLEVPDRLRVARRSSLDDTASALDGLVLLDLPDHDSMVRSHRETVDRLVGRVDVVVWVTDPVKYADALLHEEYLSGMTRHGAVLLVVLNQVDLLTGAERDMCLTDLRALLADEGLGDVEVLATSASEGAGLADLRGRLADAVARRQAATDRLAADMSAIAQRLREEADLSAASGDVDESPRPVERPQVEGLVVTDGLHASLVEARLAFAAGELAWPWARSGDSVRLPEPPPVPDSVATRLGDYVEHSTQGLAPLWRAKVRAGLRPVPSQLVDGWLQAGREVVQTDPEPRASWAGVRLAQRLVLASAAAALALSVVAGVLLARGVESYLPFGIAALLTGVAVVVGGLIVERRRQSERDDYAATEADELIQALRGRIRRDVRARLEMPLEESRRNHTAAMGALDLAEA